MANFLIIRAKLTSPKNKTKFNCTLPFEESEDVTGFSSVWGGLNGNFPSFQVHYAYSLKLQKFSVIEHFKYSEKIALLNMSDLHYLFLRYSKFSTF